MKVFSVSLLTLLLGTALYAQAGLLKSGPMLGYVEMREAAVWIQTEKEARVYALYQAIIHDETMVYSTDTIKTTTKDANTGVLIFRYLTPGISYKYSIYVNGQKAGDSNYEFTAQSDWKSTNDPPDFKVAMGSCVYINEANANGTESYGGDYQIFEHIASQNPDIMLWLGDNVYLRSSDWDSKSGYLHRYSHTRATPEMQSLLHQASNYAIWDDHEFGPNNATGSWRNKHHALEAFKLFWANPSFGTSQLQGIHSAFSYSDVDFFLMDNRYYRTDVYADGSGQIFGKEQCDLLIDRLKYSEASFKVVLTGGQFVSDAKVFENHANYVEERDYLLRRIKEEQIKNIIFLSGDRHASEVSHIILDGEIEIREFTVSPLTAGSANNEDEANSHRVSDSYTAKRNFGVMSFSGKSSNRKAHFTFYNAKGEVISDFTFVKR